MPLQGAIALILLCQLVGELAARAAGLPLPGPVLGAVLLFLYISARGGPGEDLRQLSDGLLRHLSLLFVPAGVGLTEHLDRIAQEWVAIGTAVILSTILTLVASGWTFTLVLRWQDGRRQRRGMA
ncbi:CidA/LrgA family protein [Niveispirillum irakense]|uniref:CidA/LrgA family protein n=1 Tax=Niveispirillum irakense TaxID=34011 RepID=UPI00042110F4|nr:CidA/LrgA family protein [Niveispirillum irakense]